MLYCDKKCVKQIIPLAKDKEIYQMKANNLIKK